MWHTDAVVIDFDDTIAASFDVHSNTLSKALGHFGYRVNRSILEDYWGQQFPQLIRSLAPQIDYDAFLQHYYHVMNAASPRLLPGAFEFLEAMHSRRIVTVVHSSSLTQLIWQDLRTLAIDHLILDVFGSDRTVTTKPDPTSMDVVREYLSKRGCDLSKSLYVGDSVRDFMVARGNGMPFVAIGTGLNKLPEFRAAGYHNRVFDSLSDLLKAECEG